MADEKLDPDFADLPLAARAEIEALSGIGLHHAPSEQNAQGIDRASYHPGQDVTDAVGAPGWQPIETYRDGEVVLLDDGDRQLLGRREMGLWMELADGDESARPDYRPTRWCHAAEQAKYDRM